MDRIEEICDKIGQCDDNIIEQLVARMRCIQDITGYLQIHCEEQPKDSG